MSEELSGEDLLSNPTHLKNILKDGSKSMKKSTLISLEKYVSELKETTLTEGMFDDVFKPLLHCFIDDTEKCRELSVEIIASIIHVTPDISKMLQYIIPMLVQRLANDKLVEESEEIRLALVILLNYIIQNKNNGILPYMEDCINVLKYSVVDQSPEIMKTSCAAIVTLARITVPNFHMQSESLIKPLLQILHHRHSKVRIAAIEAIGATVKYGNNKSVEDVRPGLIQRVFDQNPSVLKVLYRTMADWLLELPDRYSFFSKILPIFLSGLTSDVEDVKKECLHYWEEIGHQYLTENEDDVKDQLDFCPDSKDNLYDGIRFNLGCRKLIYRHLGPILQPLMWDLEDWLIQNKVKAAELLHTLLWNAEKDVTQYLNKVLAALLKHANDKDIPFQKWIMKSCEVIGFHISSTAWIPLVINPMKTDPSVNYLIVLAALIRRSPTESLDQAVDELIKILCDPDICLRYDVKYFEHMVEITETIFSKVPTSLSKYHYELFKLLRIIKSLANDDNIQLKTKQLLKDLDNLPHDDDNVDSSMLIYLRELHRSCSKWTSGSFHRQIYEMSALDSDLNNVEVVDEILSLLTDITKTKQEPNMKMKTVAFLGRLLQVASESPEASQVFRTKAPKVIQEHILHHMKWHAGKTENVVRSAATACLHIIVTCGWIDKGNVDQENWIPMLVATCDDENAKTRTMALEILEELVKILGCDLSYSMFLKSYPAALERLDDCCDDIRVQACKVLCQLAGSFPVDVQHAGMENQFDYLFKTALVHMDDPKEIIRQAVFDCLSKLGAVCPKVLTDKVKEVADKHRNRKLCDQLIELFEARGDH